MDGFAFLRASQVPLMQILGDMTSQNIGREMALTLLPYTFRNLAPTQAGRTHTPTEHFH